MGGFAVDPGNLRDAANKHLNNLTDDLTAAKLTVGSTSGFSPFHGEGKLFGIVNEAWEESQYYLLRVLSDNIENVDLDRKALVEIATRYGAAETEAARSVPDERR